MCLRWAPEKYIAGAALDRAALVLLVLSQTSQPGLSKRLRSQNKIVLECGLMGYDNLYYYVYRRFGEAFRTHLQLLIFLKMCMWTRVNGDAKFA
jgi:hypothetical protein